MKRPSSRDIGMHARVCSRGWSIAKTAAFYGMSESTVRRAMDRVTEFGLETGAASVNISLSRGVITVRHGTGGEILAEGAVPEGSWDKLWALLDYDLNLNRVSS